MDMKSFNKSAALIKQNGERTCAYCLAKLKDTYERKVHENNTHKEKRGDHTCKDCQSVLPTPGEAKAKAMPGRLYIHT